MMTHHMMTHYMMTHCMMTHYMMTHQVVILLLPSGVCSYHEANSLIEHVYLMRLQVLDSAGQLIQQL